MILPTRESARLALARLARRCRFPIDPNTASGNLKRSPAPAAPPAGIAAPTPGPDDQVRLALRRYLEAAVAVRGYHDDDECDRLIAHEWACWEALQTLLGNHAEDRVGLLTVDGTPYLIGVPDNRGATVYARTFDFVRTIGGGR